MGKVTPVKLTNHFAEFLTGQQRSQDVRLSPKLPQRKHMMSIETSAQATETTHPKQVLPVFLARDFSVVDGANLGDPLADADELMLDDVYHLSTNARPLQIEVAAPVDAPLHVTQTSAHATPGNAIHLDCTLTFMSPDGTTLEALVLAEVDENGGLAAVYLLPLAQITAKQDFRLVGIDRDTAKTRLAQVACVSFTRGTAITLADGRQCPIEELTPGDRVLTRDAGPQTIRWIGTNTTRATGEFAPILIKSGTLNNHDDLLVSPNHRLFIYQRNDEMGVGRAEVLVRARDLVNGETVVQVDGGHVDYFQLLFDSHQIIYAEGIAAESLPLDTRTKPALPPDLADKLAQKLPGHVDQPHRDIEVSSKTLGADAAARLRRASTG